MAIRRKQYDREFKIEAVQLAQKSGKSIALVERELGIGTGVLKRWKREFAEAGQEAFPGHGRVGPKRERVQKLERERETLRQERDILKLGGSLLRESKSARFRFIAEHEDEFPVIRMCRMLDVSPSGYYAWCQRPKRTRRP